MDRKIKYINQVACLLAIGILVSCNDYLDVEPEDKFLESQVYSTEPGIQSALNGIYLEMASEDLYGGEMTMRAVDILAQYYRGYGDYSNYTTYAYTSDEILDVSDDIWSAAYGNILNANKFLENVRANSGVLVESKENLLLGEAIALRGMMHFDLLRLYGPVYSLDSTAASIPYYHTATADYGDFLPAHEVMAYVLADLDSAAAYLAEDPILTDGKQEASLDDGEDFYRYRNWRMNIYAVRALQARAHLYAGHTEKARVLAEAIIAEASALFTWTTPTDVVSAGNDPDRIFSPEVIMGIPNNDLYDRYNDYFSPDVSNVLYPWDEQLDAMFESDQNDYRYNPSWKVVSTSVHSEHLFFKFADVSDETMVFRFMQPLIRLTELYYIAAETEPDAAAGLDYLNTVRYNRGLEDLASGVDLDEELKKEYRREFCGEGQMFFYFKRKFVTALPYATYTYTSLTYTVDEDDYQFPIPETETNYR